MTYKVSGTSMVLAALCFLLGAAPSFAGPPNNDSSDADGNTAGGSGALRFNTTGVDNTGYGFDALVDNIAGSSNTAFGAYALTSNNGIENTAVGVEALRENSGSGSDNTAVGFIALHENNTGIFNTAIGSNALLNNTTGNNNTASGVEALKLNQTGIDNTAVGFATLVNNTGSNNTASGSNALLNNTTGGFNTATGVDALNYNTNGNNNIALGVFAGSKLTTGNNNIDIGNQGAAGESNSIHIGTVGTQQATFIAGIRGVGVGGGLGVVVATNGQLGTAGSSERFKDEIKPMGKASKAILALKPVTFRYKHELDPEGIPQFGLVAEQVEKVNPDLVARDDQGKVNTVRYEAVNAMLLNEFLKQHRNVKELEATIAQQQEEIKALTASVKEQASQIRKVSAQLEVRKAAPRMIVNNQ